jgi:hypothetical protein
MRQKRAVAHWPCITIVAASFLTLAPVASAQNDLPPLKSTWVRLVDETFGCIHEEWTKTIWLAWDGPQYRDLPYSTALKKLLATTDQGECNIFHEGQWVLADYARVDLLEGFGPIQQLNDQRWYWITMGVFPPETPTNAYPK